MSPLYLWSQISLSFLLQRHQLLLLVSTLLQDNFHLNLIAAAKTLFPNMVLSTGIGGQDLNIFEAGGTQFNALHHLLARCQALTMHKVEPYEIAIFLGQKEWILDKFIRFNLKLTHWIFMTFLSIATIIIIILKGGPWRSKLFQGCIVNKSERQKSNLLNVSSEPTLLTIKICKFSLTALNLRSTQFLHAILLHYLSQNLCVYSPVFYYLSYFRKFCSLHISTLYRVYGIR